MTTGRKRWWRAAAIAAVGGVVVTGGWFGLVRATGPAKSSALPPEAANWTRSTEPATAAPTVAEVGRTPQAEPPTSPVTPAAATLPPIPMPGGTGAPVVPAIPAAPLPVPLPSGIEPVAGPRIPDAGLTGGDRSALPAVPPVPSLPPADFPALPAPPKTPEVKPVAPADMLPKTPAAPVGVPPMPDVPVAPAAPGVTAPVIPPLPTSTAEPPKALPPASASFAPMLPTPSGLDPAVLPQPTPVAPSLPPVKPADPVQPMLPAKPDSDLKPINPANTLNPTVAPTVPIAPVGPSGGPDLIAVPVDRPKPPEAPFGSSDKYVFPINPTVPDPRVPHQRDDTMLNLTTTAAFAVLGGALLAAERSPAPPVAPPSGVRPAPGMLVKADEKTDADKLKKDLDAANKRIDDLEKQVKRLTDLVGGKREGGILVDPTDPGAVEEIKRLKDKIATLEGSLKEMKGQTALRPATLPETKPRGIVKVVNEYPVEISMVVNDKSYRIAPSTKLEVEVPAGDFTYQLLQSGAAATKSVIKDKETVTLRIK